MEIFLIRHTKVDLLEPTCYGQTDLPVMDTFEQEASVTKAQLEGVEFDKVYCSPLQRAVKLAAFCGYPDAERDDRLKELFMGDMELVPFRLVPPESLQQWYSNFMGIQMPGGESTRELYLRMKSFFDELRHKPYRRVAVFYHGCAILCTRMYAGQLPLTAGFQEVSDYGSVTRIHLEPLP